MALEPPEPALPHILVPSVPQGWAGWGPRSSAPRGVGPRCDISGDVIVQGGCTATPRGQEATGGPGARVAARDSGEQLARVCVPGPAGRGVLVPPGPRHHSRAAASPLPQLAAAVPCHLPPSATPVLPTALSPALRATMSKSSGAAQTEPRAPRGCADVSVTVRTLKRKERFEVAQGSSVQQLKKEVAERFQAAPDALVLIHAGKVLKDQDTLSQHEGHSRGHIYVAIRPQKAPQDGLAERGSATPLAQPPSHTSHTSSSSLRAGSTAALHNPSQTADDLLSATICPHLGVGTATTTPLLLGLLPGTGGARVSGVDSGAVGDPVSSIRGQDVSPHSGTSETPRSAFGWDVPANTDPVRELLMASPEMQRVAEAHPEAHQYLTDPRTAGELSELCSSPAAMREVMRIRDVAMSNLESLPGGHGALEQLYREVGEPLFRAAQAQLGGNPFAAPESRAARGGGRLPAHTENRVPLPDPWALPPGGVRGGGGRRDGRPASSTGANRRASPSRCPAAGTPGAAGGQQLMGPPDPTHSPGRALATPSSTGQRLWDPTRAAWAGNSTPGGQWAPQPAPLGTVTAGAASLLRTPRAPRVLRQLQQGLWTLWAEAPGLGLGAQDERPALDPGDTDSSAGSSEPEDNDSDMESEMGADEEAPQLGFRRQMEQLSAMGFQDQRANLQALVCAGGDITAAIEILESAPAPDKTP
ncbi:ubiquilin-1-like [Podargus strigoides]